MKIRTTLTIVFSIAFLTLGYTILIIAIDDMARIIDSKRQTNYEKLIK